MVDNGEPKKIPGRAPYATGWLAVPFIVMETLDKNRIWIFLGSRVCLAMPSLCFPRHPRGSRRYLELR
jgi:hypothetical protein